MRGGGRPSPTRAQPGAIETVSLNANALRGGKLLEDTAGLFGGGAFLSMDEASGATVEQQLRDALGSNLVRVVDLFRDFDENGDGTIGKKEFRRALSRIMSSPPTQKDSDALFDSMDLDQGGTIEYKELHKLRASATDRTQARLDLGVVARPTPF